MNINNIITENNQNRVESIKLGAINAFYWPTWLIKRTLVDTVMATVNIIAICLAYLADIFLILITGILYPLFSLILGFRGKLSLRSNVIDDMLKIKE